MHDAYPTGIKGSQNYIIPTDTTFLKPLRAVMIFIPKYSPDTSCTTPYFVPHYV